MQRAVLLGVVGILIVLAGCTGTAPDGPTLNTTAPTETVSSPPAANGTLELHYINVGQSVSTLIVSPTGETVLIDTGHYTDDGTYVLSYLRRHNIMRIDHLVSSHNDADHIGGSAAVIEYYEDEADGIGAVYDSGIAASTQTYAAYLDAIEYHDVTLYETREGDTMPVDGVDVDVLGPPDPYLENDARNENSIVLKFTHGKTSFLLSGDAEDDQEAYLVDTYGSQLNATVLKAGHHGSATSNSEAFLDAIHPQAVIISSAYDSQYGHPHDTVLDRLTERAIPAYWTATHGNIVLESDGQTVSVQTQQNAPADPDTLRTGTVIPIGTATGVTERARIDGDEIATSSTDEPATETTTAEATTTGSESARALAITAIHADAAGNDHQNLNDEYIIFENTGTDSLDISGWTVTDAAAHTYTVPDGVTVAPNATVTLYTGTGTDTEGELYWGSGAAIWNNGGDTITVSTPAGERVIEVQY